jgi:CRP-like cAMP-binding protein
MMGCTDNLDRFLAHILPGVAVAALAKRLRPLAKTVLVEPGQGAGLAGGADHYVWIARGNAKLVAHGARRRDQVVEFHFAEDLVLIPARRAHEFSLDAITACELLVLPAEDLRAAAADFPAFALALLGRMESALARSRDILVTLGRKRAIERVAGFLLAIRERVARGDNGNGMILLPMSRRDIGEYLAITVESISREVGRLRKDRLIETPARAKVCILDAAGLADSAGLSRNPD